MFERGFKSPEPLADKILNPGDQEVNVNLSETSNLDSMTSEVPPQGSNDANKNKERENVCPLSFKLKVKYISIATICYEWCGLVTSTRIISG